MHIIEWASALVPPTPLLGRERERERSFALRIVMVAGLRAGKVCRGLSGAWELQGRVWGVLRAGKRQPWTSIKRRCHGLRDLLELQERSAAAWVAPGSCRGGFGEFCGLANGSLNVLKGHCQGLRDLLELQERSAAAWVAPGSCRGGFGEFCGLANGSLERP